MLSASPIYFLESLPAADLHYGTDDRSVPGENGSALEQELAQRTIPRPYSVHMYDGSGHDQPYPAAYERSRNFLMQYLAP